MKEYEDQGTGKGFQKWSRCFDCGHPFRGAVQLALGWACWKTYLGRPDRDNYRRMSMGILGSALSQSAQSEEALKVVEANLALTRRYWPNDEEGILILQVNAANCYSMCGREDEALQLRRNTHAKDRALYGAKHENAIQSGNCLAESLHTLRRYAEAKELLRKMLRLSQPLGPDHDQRLRAREQLSRVILEDPDASRADAREAVTILEDTIQRRRRVFGRRHPQTLQCEKALADAHDLLARLGET